MGLIRKSLFVSTGGLVNPSSKKQRVASRTLKEARKQTKLMEATQPRTFKSPPIKGVKLLPTEVALRCKVISDPTIQVIQLNEQGDRGTLVYPDGTRQEAWLVRTPTGVFWKYGPQFPPTKRGPYSKNSTFAKIAQLYS